MLGNLQHYSHLGCVAAVVLAVIGAGALVVLRSQRRRDLRFRHAEAALHASEERLRWAVEATSEIVWDWDLVQDTIYHPSWAHTYGFPEDRTPRTGKELATFLHPDDMPRFEEQMGRVLTGPEDTFQVEHRALTASGEWKWMNGRGRVVARDAAGRATRIVGTCTDITEHRRMQSRLQIADRMASIGTLAAGVAHEINNPLAYVLGNLEWSLQRLAPLAAAEGNAPVRACVEALREAVTGAERVREIVQDVKLFSRGGEEHVTEVHVRAALSAALALARNEIRHRAQVVIEAGEVPPVLANESRLSQVFLNLIVNAAQSIPEGHADRNVIRLVARRGEAGRVLVEVSDTGCGIPPEHRKRLFDPFFTTKPVGMGTGLGLSICHGIVSALGGEIEVESEVGKGSTFRVILPEAGQARREEAVTQLSPRPRWRRARILLVDDEPLFCRMVERALEGEHDVVALTDPREALRRVCAGERFDALLTNLAMPTLSGVELHAEIARVDPELAARTVFATGGAFTPLTSDFVARNMGRVVEKPLGSSALRSAIAEVLGRAPLAVGAPAATPDRGELAPQVSANAGAAL